jgi:peptide/nickel transport system ATP-binding protein
MSAAPILEVRDLRVDFMAGDHRVQAVRGVDFAIPTGGTLGIVGESGSGKSITMRAVLGLLPGNARVAGSVRFCGEELIGATPQRLRAIRGARIGMIFQDPMTALNPLHTIGAQIVEAIRIHDHAISQRAARDRTVELLNLVAIPFPERRIDQYPHEFSGGMRQRVVIAIAVANNPELLIADEPTTALDVTVQAQILDVLARLQKERGVSLALITHDLGVVAGVADQVAVMYGGRIVERSAAAEIFYRSKHPYTRGLLGATPTVDKPVARLAAIDGAPPSLATRPSGCAFRPRCPLATPRCAAEDPPMRAVGASFTACHHAELLSASFSPNAQPPNSQPTGGPRAAR